MKKLAIFAAALMLTLGLAQCKKEQPSTTESEPKTIHITVNVGGSSKHVVDPSLGTVNYSDGDVLYVGNGSTYIGTLTCASGVFSGEINKPTGENPQMHFYFVGGRPSGELSKGSTTSFNVDISDQSSGELPVLSYTSVAYETDKTDYECELKNKCALVKYTFTNESRTVRVGGRYTQATINFGSTPGIVPNTETTGFITLKSGGATEKYGIFLPQDAVEGTDAQMIMGYDGYTLNVPVIGHNDYTTINGNEAVTNNIVYLNYLTRNYTATNGKILTGTLSGNYKISVENKVGGATVTLRNATIKYTTINTNWAGLSCLGDATIMLEGTNIVESGMYKSGSYNIADYPGIHIATSHTLTIDGSGELTTSSCRQTNFSRGAGIGGGYNEACGDIIIKGGIIHALGGKYDAAGIGSAGNYNNNAACGNITIEGGEVEAIAYGVAAGIGCGLMNRCGKILITNGAVTAQGGEGSAGIGAAHSANNSSGASNSQCGTITIEGGTVTATGGPFGAGIGSGTSRGDYSRSICGTITIEGGTVTATGGEGGMVDSNVFYGAAGIGTGSSILGGYNGYSDCGDITITSGVTSVTATKGGGTYPAENSIGKNHSSGSGTCGTVKIGGTVTGNISTSPFTYHP